jgi:hypothetical protein
MNDLTLITPVNEWKMIKEQAAILVSSGMIPKSIRTPEAAIAIMIKGREIGIQPMHAFSHIHIVEGKPTMSAELMMTMILKNVPNAKIEFLEVSGEACRIRASRPATGSFEFSFTREDATKAQLMGKDNWKKYTRAMLRSRVVSEMARSMFPDALSGISYTPEELGHAVEVTESGEIIVAEEIIPAAIVKTLRDYVIDISNYIQIHGRASVASALMIAEEDIPKIKTWNLDQLKEAVDALFMLLGPLQKKS